MSRRFQIPGEPWVDKALYSVGGAPMIKVVFDKLSEVSDRVVLALGSPGRVDSYRRVLGDFTYVVDDNILRGPLAGVYSALRVCGNDRVVIVPVDAPYVSTRLLLELLDATRGYDVVSPILPNGLVETAFIALRGDVASWVLEIVRSHGRSRIADLHRGAPRVYLVNVRERGYQPREFTNINRREDLNTTLNSYPEGPVRGDVEIVRDFTRDDVLGRSPRILGSLWGTLYLGGYLEEFKIYASRYAYMLAAYSLLDSPSEGERLLGDMIVELLKRGWSA
jgi:molybdopterin-guanine dinucleotide biosynthesis protein A